MPPITWQSLWCRALPAANASPASQAPVSAVARASASRGLRHGRGDARGEQAQALPRGDVGERRRARGPHSASTQCATAFMPLAAVTSAGRS